MGARTKLLTHKNRGGVANFSGNAFESFFAVWRVSLALEAFCHGRTARLALQLKDCHVDDWVEDTPTERQYFQLKRSANVRWSAVRSDFVAQFAQAPRRKLIAVTLVVPSRAQAKELKRAKDRVTGASTMFFPKNLRPKLVLHRDPAIGVLRRLSSSDKPTKSDLECVWFAIDVAWQNARKPRHFVPITSVLREVPDRDLDLLRHPWSAPPNWPAFEKLLTAVPGLSFRIDGGHFTYSGAGQTGRYSSRNRDLGKLVRRALKKPPMTLNDFMELL